jgi:DHA2 family multidrug resistance protein
LDWLDTTIANVVLNYMAGGMGVSEDEATWVVACVRRRHLSVCPAKRRVAPASGRSAFAGGYSLLRLV